MESISFVVSLRFENNYLMGTGKISTVIAKATFFADRF
jgi:hypothetical protein